MKKKKISIMIPCFNEEENVVPISERIVEIMTGELPQYDYELLFIDNFSTDGTRELLEEICSKNKKIKAIFNVTNFGQFNSPFTECARQAVTAPFPWPVISRIRRSLSHSL